MGLTPKQNETNEAAAWLARPMFGLSLAFLVLIAALIVLWVDIPRVELMAADALDTNEVISDHEKSWLERNTTQLGDFCLYALIVIWPLFWAEFIFKFRKHDHQVVNFLPRRLFDSLVCICPPLRLAAPSYEMGNQIWLPKLGWQQPGKQLTRILEKFFGGPMLLIALFILPILLIEFGLKETVESNFGLRIALHICTGLIWTAFAIEFLIMICATEKKLAYVKKNWIDLAIILLPLISFLRSLRAVRAFRFAKLAQFNQLTRLTRVYRMRGLLTKALKALMLLEVINRLLRLTPEKRLDRMKALREERLEEIRDLDSEIEKLQSTIELQAIEDKKSPEETVAQTSSERDAVVQEPLESVAKTLKGPTSKKGAKPDVKVA